MRLPIPFHPRLSRSRAAFTLLEILVAIGIFAFVMAAIYSSWSAIMRGARSGMKAAGEVQRTRIAIRSLEESLGSAVLYQDNIKYYSFFADTSGNYHYLSFVARLPETFPGSGLYNGQNLRRVTFSVDDKNQLTLQQHSILEAHDKVEKPYTIILAPQIGLFAVEFYDSRKNEWIPEWTWTNQLPKMVRVAIGFGPKEQYSRRTEDVTMRAIPLNSVAITRVGSGGGQAPRTALNRPGQMAPRVGGGNPMNRNVRGAPESMEEEGVIGDATGMTAWSPPISSSFFQNRGSVGARHPVFP